MSRSSVAAVKPLTEELRRSLRSGRCPSDCPLVLVCRRCKGHEKVLGYLIKRTKADIRTVRCQKVCEGPVCGLQVGGRMEWFEDMDGSEQLKAIARLMRQKPPSDLPKPLRKRRSRKHSGRLPR